jgi:hypothetical protein
MDKRPLPSEALLTGGGFDVGGPVRALDTSRGSASQPRTYGGVSRRDVATDVYNAFRRQGFSDQQAMALTAEINRENSFNPNHLFGSHLDPHNRATNVGMLSWQGERANRVMDYMGQQGLLDEQGRIMQTPEALDAQAAYLRWEMENLPEYQRTKEQFLANPDIDFDTAHTVLGDNFIRWRRTDPQYRDSGYGRINEGYALLTGDDTGGFTPTISTSGTMSAPPPARPEGLSGPEQEQEARGPMDDLTDALAYLELAEGPSEMPVGSPPPVIRPRRSDTGTRALQRMGIASLA